MKQIKLSIEAAEQITICTLKDYRDNLKKELHKWKKNPRSDINPTGYWLHPDDVVGNTHTIAAIDLIIRHFGG